MKRSIICLVLALMSVAGYAQNVLGKWVTTDNESNVEIYQSGDKLYGKIIWLKRGEGQLDVHNPDKSLRSRKLLGVNILTGLTKNGKTYKCTIWLEGNTLKVRGYVGVFYETHIWTRE